MAGKLVRHAVNLWALAAVLTTGCCHTRCHKASCCTCHHCGFQEGGAPASEKGPQPSYLPARAAANGEPPLSEGSVAAATPASTQARGDLHSKLASASAPAAAFGHAPDYSWISGELWYVPGKNVWRVHYAGPADRDKYGGVMTLSDAGPMADYRIGQLVYVEGRPAEGSGQSGTAVYRVTKLLELVNSDGTQPAGDPAVERVSVREEGAE